MTKRSLPLLILILIISFYFCHDAFAMNADYLDAQKWVGNSNVTVTQIRKTVTARDGEYVLSGNYGFYIDNDSMCIYTYFAVQEDSSSSAMQSMTANYTFISPSETYNFSVDKNGITDDSPEEEKKLFAVRSNYYGDRNCFITACQYNGKESALKIETSLSVNGHIYLIDDSLVMEKPVTTKAAATQPAKESAAKSGSASNSASSSSKSSSATKSRGKTTTKAKSKSTTKFTSKGRYTTAPRSASKKRSSHAGSVKSNKSSNETKESSSKFAPSSGTVYPAGTSEIYVEGESFEGNKNKTDAANVQMRMPKYALILLITALIAAAVGLTLIITAALLKKKGRKEYEEKTESPDTGE